MPFAYNGKLLPRAKDMRREMTKYERILWFSFLKDCPLRFRRQFVVGSYIVDFYCAKAKLVMEVDGETNRDTAPYDDVRARFLASLGIQVLRFANTEIENSLSSVIRRISATLKEADPCPNTP